MSRLQRGLQRLKQSKQTAEPHIDNHKDQVSETYNNNNVISSSPSSHLPLSSLQKQEQKEDWSALQAAWYPYESTGFVRRIKKFPLHTTFGQYMLQQFLIEAAALTELIQQKQKHTPEASEATTQISSQAAVEATVSTAAETKTESDVAPSTVQYDQLLFFDSETTGLGMGTGNIPFLIGMGYVDVEHDAFVVEQLFMRNPSEENAMLRYVKHKMSAYPHWVSYNGKSFDWPLIKNRFVLHRIQWEDSTLHHFDFLHPSRSLWKRILPTCRLQHVEQMKLGIEREGDVPGSMAPQLYFQYLAEKDNTLLQGVFEHNEQDIVSLVLLAIHLCQAVQGKLDITAMRAEEIFQLGQWFIRIGKEDDAHELMQYVYELHDHEQRNSEVTGISLPLAAYFKKKNKLHEAVQLWKVHIQQEQQRTLKSVEPYIELAKYYEHKTKSLDVALYYAEQAKQTFVATVNMTANRNKEKKTLEAVNHRIQRLRHKLGGAQ
ncbi:ribonuclease H-like domain-containing protein [Longirhabdus pacifica]|uniref:ribonuclease H-like domain-containing protein n=1 Tax=Longirhabdus pacifica TaxID=2305227 RepID=UPI0013E8B57E|nr:ribonuclease H-like domain-containing protein [Longirhabdus pacifica]